jgi:hypothetical protein
MRSLRSLLVVSQVLSLGAATALLTSCPAAPLKARAAQITHRAELIGGPRALGEVGDWLLENDKVRFIIQDAGFSRGFGVFGGALLDADLVRPEAGRGDSTGGNGRDNFGEMFPAFFLEALNPTEIVDPNDPTGQTLLPPIAVENDGSDGKAAVLVVRAQGDDFLAITQSVNETALGDERFNPTFVFETRYILEPGAQHLVIDTRIQNRKPQRQEFPKELLGNQIPTPFGDVVLFGAGNKVFLPHEAGFDIRFRLEDIYAAGNIALPAFPGLVAEFIASASKDVSYGVLSFPPEGGAQNFALANASAFPDATDHSIHVPFIASAFTGLFQVLPPPELAPNDFAAGGADEFHVRRAFIVGDGDVASISDVVYDLLGDKTGKLEGRVAEKQLPNFVGDASVIVLKENGDKVTQAKTDKEGRFDAKLRPGHYQVQVVVAGQDPTPPVGVDIAAGKTTFENLFVDAPAEIVVTVVEENVGRVPAKVMLVGTTRPEDAGKDPKRFLFDLSMGQSFLYTDFIPDDADKPETRQYLEAFGTSADGVIRLKARPGKYKVFASRGVEYDREELPGSVELKAGETIARQITIHRTVDTRGYVSADFHLHSQFSLDSAAKVEDRITNYAAEGMELAVSTDHNFVVDYQPVLEKLGLERFMNTAVGLELTTIDRGHFNGFPLKRQDGSLTDKDGDGKLADDSIASRTYGSFEWALRTPDEIFTDLRALKMTDAKGEVPVIVQVNHPRDSILGYFEQYGVNADTLEPEGIQNALLKPSDTLHPEFDKQNFSFDFDALEVFNGKRFEFLHSFRVPANAPHFLVDGVDTVVDPVSCCPTQTGAVLREGKEKKCPGDAETCACDESVLKFNVDEGTCQVIGDVAFPGVVEDWMKLLETGKRVVGTANSDSHEPEKEEPGSPRTWVAAPSDDPAQVTPRNIVEAFQKGDVLMSNGPFIRVTASGTGGDVGMGGVVVPKDGKVKLKIHVESANWVKPNVLHVYENGELVDLNGAEPGEGLAIDGPGKHDFEADVDAGSDGFLVVEATVEGDQKAFDEASLFPSVYPNEVPPLQFTDVIGSIGASFGLGADADALKPQLTFVTTPYALTNPIWIDADGDGEVTPSRELPDPLAVVHADAPRLPSLMKEVEIPWVETADEAAKAEWMKLPLRKRIALARLPRWLWPSDDPRDVRRVLLQFVKHAD